MHLINGSTGEGRSTNSSHRASTSTAELEAIQALFRHPGWAAFQHYLKARRRNAARWLLYQMDSNVHVTENGRMQGVVKLIDEILADSADASRILAHKIHDHLESACDSPYRGEDLNE